MNKKTKKAIILTIGSLVVSAMWGWILYTCLVSPDPFYEAIESNGRTPAYNRMMNIDVD